MVRKAAIALALVMLAFVAWGLLIDEGSTRIIINGHELAEPLKGTVGAAGLVIGLIALFCAAIFLLFVFAGIGIIILAGLSFPLLLVMLLPLAVVWLFIAITRKTEA